MAFSSSRPYKPFAHSKTKFPRETQPSTRNRAGLDVISGEIADRSSVKGCGFDTGTREVGAPIPRTHALLDTPESTTQFRNFTSN